MDPTRPNYRYGYGANTNNKLLFDGFIPLDDELLPPEAFDDDYIPSEGTSRYGTWRDFESPLRESYDSNNRPDNPFLPRGSAEGSSQSAPPQRSDQYPQNPFSTIPEDRQYSQYDLAENRNLFARPYTSYPRSVTNNVT